MREVITLVQTLQHPVFGFWDGGPKQVFEWRIEHSRTGRDSQGTFVRIGSWEANHWFHVALGKTDKQTLGYAKQHLRKFTKIPCDFEYKVTKYDF